jgi:hypothetical protein
MKIGSNNGFQSIPPGHPSSVESKDFASTNLFDLLLNSASIESEHLSRQGVNKQAPEAVDVLAIRALELNDNFSRQDAQALLEIVFDRLSDATEESMADGSQDSAQQLTTQHLNSAALTVNPSSNIFTGQSTYIANEIAFDDMEDFAFEANIDANGAMHDKEQILNLDIRPNVFDTGLASKSTIFESLVPWKLQSSDSLSQILKIHIQGRISSMNTERHSIAIADGNDNLQSATHFVGFSPVDKVLPKTEHDLAIDSNRRIEPAVDAKEVSEIEDELGAAAQSNQAAWLLKNLKWVRDSQGAWVVYARDFYIDNDQRMQFIQAVIDRSKQEGFTLGRIVLNGNEVWNKNHQQLIGGNHAS